MTPTLPIDHVTASWARIVDRAFPRGPVAHREVISALPDGPAANPPLLMVHGLAHGAWCFGEHWVPGAAERGWPAYAVSLRGHGGSSGAPRLRRTLQRDYVQDVRETIAELPEPPVLIGHSNGAVVSQLVARQTPLRALVLLTPAPLHSAVPDLLAVARDRPLDALGATFGRTLSMEPDILFEGLDAATARAYSDRTQPESPFVQWELLLPRRSPTLDCPVLVVGAPADRLVRPADVARTAAAYGVEPVWFPGMGHDVMLDRGWDRVLHAVLDFAARSLPASHTTP
jgi:pimeloyl-ACP methyl ester carboxylesterase